MGVSGPAVEGRPVQGGSCLVPSVAWRGCGHQRLSTGVSGWERMILLGFIHLSEMYVEVTFISVYNIRRDLGLCLEFW